ncbi:MAG: hypothetical protein GC204_10845 [Chloroflexi bacterium]|nr:hypothetical protein [Chloroflexota bacterium]
MTLTRNQWIIIVVLAALALAARALPGARTIDDAFITFRYSRNIVEGEGFVYNPGVQTLGTTTPLFALTMAAISKIAGGEDYQNYAIAVSAIADAISVALIFLIARTAIESDLIAALPAALWAISPMSVTFAVGGMETSVNILWMVAATWFYVAQRHRPKRAQIGMGICAALGLLTRIDAGFWIAPLFLFQLGECVMQGRSSAAPQQRESLIQRLPWRTWIAGGLVLLPWVIFSMAYFGTPIPNSVTAKRFAYLIQPGSALVRLIQTYSTPFFEFNTFGSLGTMIAAVLYLTLSLFAFIYIARKNPRLLPALIYPWVYLLIFSLLNPLIFRWYMAPPLPALMLGIVIGAWSIVRPRKAGVSRRLATVIVGLFGCVWLFTSINGWALHPAQGPDRPAPEMAWNALELLYQQMGNHLHDDLKVTAQTRVASGDIGAIGYFSRATIVDTVGLVTPELTRYYPVDPALIASDQNYAIPPQLIYDTQPDYLVTMEGFVREGLAKQTQFHDEYDLVTEYPFEFYGSSMQLYAKK